MCVRVCVCFGEGVLERMHGASVVFYVVGSVRVYVWMGCPGEMVRRRLVRRFGIGDKSTFDFGGSRPSTK